MHPSNALMFYGLLVGVANFQLIDVQQLQEDILNFSEEGDHSHTLNFELMGYESSNAILNLGMMFMFLFFSIAMIVVIYGS